MKISKEQKEKNRKALLKAGASLIAKKGYKNASMREIAQAAEMSDAAIYKYFPAKENLLFAYFENSFDESVEKLKTVPNYDEFSFVEQIHLLVETQLQIFAEDKDFVDQAFSEVFVTTLRGANSEAREHRDRYLEFVHRYLEAAIHAGEYKGVPNINFISELFWDWQIGVVYYWLRDKSKNYEKTTEVMDKSLALFHEVLNSGILDKVSDLLFFFLRNHLFDRMGNLTELSAPQRVAKKKFLSKKK